MTAQSLALRARIVLASHLGRPKDAPDPKLSLAPVASALAAIRPQVTNGG